MFMAKGNPMCVPLQLESFCSEGILDALPDGAYVTDCDRKIIFWNRAAERITGWQREEVIGKHCSDNILVHIDKDGNRLCSCDCCPLYRSIVTGENSETAVLVFAQGRDGSRIPMEVSVAPLRNAAGEVIGGVETFRDMAATMKDLNRARLIQKNALQFTPVDDARLKIATLCIPHDMVGGDFLHVEALDADRYAVFVADVTGHGVAAALYTMQLRSLCEEHREVLGDPPEFMSALNARLHVLANQNDYFATAAHFVVNAATGQVTYACAGHESPLVMRLDGMVEKLNHKDPCLGLFADTVFHRSEAQVEPGESLLLFTDGAVEIDDAGGSELGLDGLCEILQNRDFSEPQAALEQVEGELLAYSHHVRLPDDMTLLCLHRVAK